MADLREVLVESTAYARMMLAFIPKQYQPVASVDVSSSEEEDSAGEGSARKVAPRHLKKFGNKPRARNIGELHQRIFEKMNQMKGNRGKKRKRTREEGTEKGKRMRVTHQLVSQQTETAPVQEEKSQAVKEPVGKSVKERDAGVAAFSKLEFPSDVLGHPLNSKKKKKKPGLGKEEIMLKKVEKRKATEAKLIEQGREEDAKQFKKKHEWDTALQRAGGEKVKDDPLLLKKAVKRKEKRKKRSEKKWQQRIEAAETGKQRQQEKRKQNLEKRKDEKKKKKVNRSIKKGRVVF